MKALLKLSLFVTICVGLYFFCNAQTQGFRPYLILSNLPNEPRWEVPPLSIAEQEKIYQSLNQSFTFLGSGGWCYAFLGEDQKTVLKFYKHTHLKLDTLLKELCFKKLLFISPPWPKGQSYFQEFNFTSCTLLYTCAKERTGLRYVHLNKTQNLLPQVTLVDPIGVKHTIELDQTEFVIQDRAELILPHLDALMQKGDTEGAKHCVQEIITCLKELYQEGFHDVDFSFRNNFGYIEEKAVTLDLSSFIFDPNLKGKGDYSKEIRQKTKRLEHHLKKYHPPLYTYYQECL